MRYKYQILPEMRGKQVRGWAALETRSSGFKSSSAALICVILGKKFFSKPQSPCP